MHDLEMVDGMTYGRGGVARHAKDTRRQQTLDGEHSSRKQQDGSPLRAWGSGDVPALRPVDVPGVRAFCCTAGQSGPRPFDS